MIVLLYQIHYLNPEDLLKMETEYLPKLTNEEYNRRNEKVLLDIKNSGTVYNYTRISMDEKYSDDVKKWNKEMTLWQRLRIRSSQIKESNSGGGVDDELIIETEYSSDSVSMGGDE